MLFNLNVLANGFGWDDADIIRAIRITDHWWDLFLPGPNSKEAVSYYRPFVVVAYLADLLIWGQNPFGFHLSVFLAHLVNTALVYFLTQALVKDKATPNVFLPLFSASLFGVHPVHAEAIAWIAGRNDVFCTTFILSSVLLYIRFRQSGRERLFGLSMLAFFFALLTKETATGLVFLYPLYDFLYEPRPSKRWTRVRFLIPLAVLGFYFFLRTVHITQSLGDPFSQEAPSSFFTMIGAAGLYLKLMLFPYPHNPFIATVPASSIFLVLAGLSLMVLIGGMIWAVVRRNRLIGWGLVWTAVFLAPAIPVAAWNLAATPAAERYLYAPSIGFLMALGGMMFRAVDRLRARMKAPPRNVWITVCLLWLVLVSVWGLESRNRNIVWRSPLTFWQAAVAALSGNEPREATAYNNLGVEYKARRRISESIQEFQIAIGLQQDFAEAHNNLGTAYEDAGRLEQALQEYQAAVKLRPNFVEAYTNMGIALAKQGQMEEAVQKFQAAIKLDMRHQNAHYNLGKAYALQGKLEEAIQEYQIALRLRPDDPEARNNLGEIYAHQGRIKDAITEYQAAAQADPNDAQAYYNLGTAYARMGRSEEARKHYQHALRIRPDFEPARQALLSLVR